MWIATDPDHTARAVVLARIALGSQGIRVGPADWPTPSSAERRRLLRDALSLTLWQATGSTVARLVPDALARKRADCGVLAWQPRESRLNVCPAAGREGSVGLGVSSWRWHQALPGRRTLAAISAERPANPRCDWLSFQPHVRSIRKKPGFLRMIGRIDAGLVP